MTWKHISPLETATRNRRAYSLAALSFALKEAHSELSRLSLNEFMLWLERHEKATSDDEPDLVLLEGHMEYYFYVANLFWLVFSWFHAWLK